jgi:hypothetical protein
MRCPAARIAVTCTISHVNDGGLTVKTRIETRRANEESLASAALVLVELTVEELRLVAGAEGGAELTGGELTGGDSDIGALAESAKKKPGDYVQHL